jgi:hypothetical protein
MLCDCCISMLYVDEGDIIPLDQQHTYTSTSLHPNIHVALIASGRMTVKAASKQQKMLLLQLELCFSTAPPRLRSLLSLITTRGQVLPYVLCQSLHEPRHRVVSIRNKRRRMSSLQETTSRLHGSFCVTHQQTAGHLKPACTRLCKNPVTQAMRRAASSNFLCVARSCVSWQRPTNRSCSSSSASSCSSSMLATMPAAVHWSTDGLLCSAYCVPGVQPLPTAWPGIDQLDTLHDEAESIRISSSDMEGMTNEQKGKERGSETTRQQVPKRATLRRMMCDTMLTP